MPETKKNYKPYKAANWIKVTLLILETYQKLVNVHNLDGSRHLVMKQYFNCASIKRKKELYCVSFVILDERKENK